MTEGDADRLERVERLLESILTELERRRVTEDLMLEALADFGQRLAIDANITRRLKRLAQARQERDTLPAPEPGAE